MKLFPRPGNSKTAERSSNRGTPNGRPPANRADGLRPRPPGPEAPRYRGAGPPPDPGERGPRRYLNLLARRWLWLLAALLLVNWLVTPLFLQESAPNRITVPYSMFKAEVEKGNVAEIVSQGDVVQGTFKQAVTSPQTPRAGREPERS